jgi:hypothetical protein
MTTSPQDNFFKRIWKAWIQFGHLIGEIMSWVWMPLFYYIVAMPVAVGIKLFKDPLQLRTGKKASYWTRKEMPEMDMAWAKSQGSTVLPDSDTK